MADMLCKAFSDVSLCASAAPIPFRPFTVNMASTAAAAGSIAARVTAARALLERPAFVDRVKYLNKPGVLEWVYAEPTFIKKLTQETEKLWGTDTIGYKTGQWTTELGENIINDILTVSGKNPHKIKTHQRAANNKRLDPDREADDGLYECKARNYGTTGTAGEKILGCPIKYCEVPRLYGKPLYIVCLGFQEIEAAKDFQLFEPQSEELRMQLAFWKDMFSISFVRATAMIDAFVEGELQKDKKDATDSPITPPSPPPARTQSVRQPATLVSSR